MSDKRDQLCWSCTKACGQCSWSRELTPVEGWTAEQVVYPGLEVEDDTTYHITACPEFVRDPRRERKPKRDNGVARTPVPCKGICILTGEERYYDSLRAASKDGFRVEAVSKVVQGEFKQHRGWRFESLGKVGE